MQSLKGLKKQLNSITGSHRVQRLQGSKLSPFGRSRPSATSNYRQKTNLVLKLPLDSQDSREKRLKYSEKG